MRTLLKFSLLSMITLFVSISSFARGGGGGHSLGIGFGIATPSQDDLDNLSQSLGTSKMGSATEFEAHYQYRFGSDMWAIQFRPSYFTQTGGGAANKNTLTGMTFFPMVRLYPLENAFIHFFMQAGLGYGQITGKIEQAAGSVDFSGGAFGAMAGLGAEFCFTPNHCAFLEGNFRYLPIERSIISSSTGTVSSTLSSANGQELEYLSNDLKTTLSGIIGTVGYHINF